MISEDSPLYQNEIPMPGPDDRYAGIRALWIKVIIRAIFDWVTYRDSLDLKRKKEAENASTWLFKPSVVFNSFENVCYYVGLNPDDVRDQVQSMSKEDAKKIEYLERSDREGRELAKRNSYQASRYQELKLETSLSL